MISDFCWGTASAQPVTLSFWAWSSLTGTLGGSLRNYAATRTYPFSYSLPASTWTKIVITIPGDTAGTWVMNGNAGGERSFLSMGVGSTFAGQRTHGRRRITWLRQARLASLEPTPRQFLVTGVKLEIGSVATPYNRQSLTKSMADCQRYYYQGPYLGSGYDTAGAFL